MNTPARNDGAPEVRTSDSAYLPVLDGLRALAILMVMMEHFNVESALKAALPVLGPVVTKFALYGLRGVDLFFVLSGFLITRILLNARNDPPSAYYSTFYARRFLRIFPLYYACLAVIFLVLPRFVSFDAPGLEIASHQWRLWAYVSNWPFGSPGWDGSSMFALGHFWSLSVEENFYLLWPLLVYTLATRRLRTVCILWAALGFALGFAESISEAMGHGTSLLRWSTMTHSGGLALGALAAIAYRDSGAWARLSRFSRVSFPALALLFVASAALPRRWHYEVQFTALSGICAMLFLASMVLCLNMPADRGISRALRHPAMRYIGKISYGLYVYHGLLRPVLTRAFEQQVFWPALQTPLGTAIGYPVFAIGASVAVATASWYCFEQPILRLKSRFRYSGPARKSGLKEVADAVPVS